MVTLTHDGLMKAIAIGVLERDKEKLASLARKHQWLTQERLYVEKRMREVAEHKAQREMILEILE